jgi:hypothetical protein
MKIRTVLVLMAASAISLISSAVPTSASESRRPSVEILGLDGTATGPEGEVEHIIAIDARDLDGIITEVQVEFSNGTIVFAHTYCVLFGKGETAHMRIGNSFPGPGTYEVHARALSVRECGARGSQHSRWDVEQVTIPAA